MQGQEPELVLVTGWAGRLGHRVTTDLSRDYRVIGLDIATPGAAAPPEHVHCDLADDASVERALADVRERAGGRVAAVVHLASHYDFAPEPGERCRQVSVEGTRRLLAGLHDFEVGRLVFASTTLVMEPADVGELIVEESPVHCIWDHPRAKLAGESVLCCERGEIPVTILRFGSLYDEQGNSLALKRPIFRVLDERIGADLLPSHPEHRQAYVHFDDAAAAVRCVVEQRDEQDELSVFFVAEPRPPSHSDLIYTAGDLIHGGDWPPASSDSDVCRFGRWSPRPDTAESHLVEHWAFDLCDAHYPLLVEKIRDELGWTARRRLALELPAIVDNLCQALRRPLRAPARLRAAAHARPSTTAGAMFDSES